jgi:1,4-dihydroxy-6-naphthoate synthase
MGDGYGPRLVARHSRPSDPQAALAGRRVAVPGKLTTAYLALRLFQPSFDAVVMPFDQIEGAVAAGTVDAGLLIHEGQLTYADQGFELWADLGAWWLEQTKLPLPLGGNVVRRDLGDRVMRQIARDLRASIEYGLEHRVPALAHARQFSRGLSEDRTDAFVGMYVNHWTVDYGARGRAAVQRLLDEGHRAGVIPAPVRVDFVE